MLSPPTGPDALNRRQTLLQMLRHGPLSAQALAQALGVSQPTLSRTIHATGDAIRTFRIPGDRTPRYASLRSLPGGINARQTIYRIAQSGAIAPFAQVEFLTGGATLERGAEGRPNALYEGLPPYMAFASPSGFLGRQVAHAVAQEMQVPESLKDWGDDHRIAYLFTRGQNLAGNLIYGEASLQREMAFRQAEATSLADKLDHYVAMANRIKDAAYGSSAGGEQPKFLGLAEDAGHVIVKFARQGSRMGELLPMEHLALEALAQVGIPAAPSRVLAAGGYVFLEVQRFDRLGRHGRVGMLSAGAVDDEFFGLRDSWSEFASRCEDAHYLSSADARRIDAMAAFSELIGNGDRHLENISVLIGDDGEYLGLAPAYDILPMCYASIGAGVDPELKPIVPRIGTIGAKPAVWTLAARAADAFWTDVAQAPLDTGISDAFRNLAQHNREAARSFATPLLPPGTVR